MLETLSHVPGVDVVAYQPFDRPLDASPAQVRELRALSSAVLTPGDQPLEPLQERYAKLGTGRQLRWQGGTTRGFKTLARLGRVTARTLMRHRPVVFVIRRRDHLQRTISRIRGVLQFELVGAERRPAPPPSRVGWRQFWSAWRVVVGEDVAQGWRERFLTALGCRVHRLVYEEFLYDPIGFTHAAASALGIGLDSAQTARVVSRPIRYRKVHQDRNVSYIAQAEALEPGWTWAERRSSALHRPYEALANARLREWQQELGTAPAQHWTLAGNTTLRASEGVAAALARSVLGPGMSGPGPDVGHPLLFSTRYGRFELDTPRGLCRACTPPMAREVLGREVAVAVATRMGDGLIAEGTLVASEQGLVAVLADADSFAVAWPAVQRGVVLNLSADGAVCIDDRGEASARAPVAAIRLAPGADRPLAAAAAVEALMDRAIGGTPTGALLRLVAELVRTTPVLG